MLVPCVGPTVLGGLIIYYDYLLSSIFQQQIHQLSALYRISRPQGEYVRHLSHGRAHNNWHTSANHHFSPKTNTSREWVHNAHGRSPGRGSWVTAATGLARSKIEEKLPHHWSSSNTLTFLCVCSGGSLMLMGQNVKCHVSSFATPLHSRKDFFDTF